MWLAGGGQGHRLPDSGAPLGRLQQPLASYIARRRDSLREGCSTLIKIAY